MGKRDRNRPIGAGATALVSMLIAATAAAALEPDRTSIEYTHAFVAPGVGFIEAAPVDDVCRKDHSGLALGAAEPMEHAQARLADAIDKGGALIAAKVEGLGCGYCAAALEKTLASRPGVMAASVNVRSGDIFIVADPAAGFDDARLRRIVDSRGYDLTAIDRTVAMHAAEKTPRVDP